jgi:ABC-2 type transport system permease protein
MGFVGFELRKFLRQKGIYILMGAALVLLMLNLWTYDLIYSVEGLMMPEEEAILNGIIPNLSSLYAMTGALTNANFGTILAVMVALYVCADHSDGTLKNIIGRGYSRVQIFGSKYGVCLIGAFAMAVICWVVGFLFGGLLWGFEGEWSGAVFGAFGVQAVSIVAYTTLFFLVACVLKNIGGSLAVGIVIQMVPTLIFTLLDLFIENKSFMLMDYWIEGGMAVTDATASEDLSRIAIVSGVYAVVFLVLSLLAVRKREI